MADSNVSIDGPDDAGSSSGSESAALTLQGVIPANGSEATATVSINVTGVTINAVILPSSSVDPTAERINAHQDALGNDLPVGQYVAHSVTSTGIQTLTNFQNFGSGMFKVHFALGSMVVRSSEINVYRLIDKTISLFDNGSEYCA